MAKLESIYVRRDRLAGGLQGLLIGDALGVPYEFHDPLDLPPQAQIDFDPPEGFPRSHEGVPPGTWSDDGAQALCLLQSLLDSTSPHVQSCVARSTLRCPLDRLSSALLVCLSQQMVTAC